MRNIFSVLFSSRREAPGPRPGRRKSARRCIWRRETGGESPRCRKTGDHVGVVHHHQQQHQDERDAQPELFADEVAKPLAGDHPHARAHLLHHDQRNGDGNHRPQERVSELCAGLGIGEDAPGVIIDIGGNESGAKNGQKEHYLDSPALPHAVGFLWWVHLGVCSTHRVSSLTISGQTRRREPGKLIEHR